jgi:uncharacterized delta-60 repeat protein
MIRTPMLAVALAGIVLQAGPGSLDMTFGHDGKVTASVGFASAGRALAIQRDGKIVVGGWSTDNGGATYRWALARFNPNGRLDTTFGFRGKVRLGMGAGFGVWALAVQRDGKIVAAGWKVDGGASFELVRLKGNGALDRTFGDDGRVMTPVVSGALAFALAIQRDGKIIVAGGGREF